MKRKVLALAIVAALASSLGLIGCAQSDDASSSQEDQAQAQAQANSEAEIQETVDSIDAIGSVTLESEKAITKARKAYDGLSPEQQEAVGNYDTLVAAEKAYADLEVASKAMTVGETVSDKDFSVTLTDASISATLESPDSRTYWEADDGSVFAILEFDVEALNSEQIAVDSGAVTDLVANFNGNTYKNWDYKYLASELWLSAKRTYFDANMPVHIYVYTSLPAAASDGTVTVDMKIAGQSKQIAI